MIKVVLTIVSLVAFAIAMLPVPPIAPYKIEAVAFGLFFWELGTLV